jgi:hypothetical protein
MASMIVWVLLMIFGGIGGIVIINLFEVSGYAVMLGMIAALLSGILFQLNLMHREKD